MHSTSAEGPGFEPGLMDPESTVLPLNYPSKRERIVSRGSREDQDQVKHFRCAGVGQLMPLPPGVELALRPSSS